MSQTGVLSKEDTAKLKGIIKSCKNIQGALIQVLHQVQDYFGYIPYEAQRIISMEMGIPISEIYGVVTFYPQFTLKSKGKYKISVCLGTACYVKGASQVLEKVQEILGVKVGDSSDDGMYSVETTRCIGACGLAPVMTINEDVYGKVTPDEVPAILEKYRY